MDFDKNASLVEKAERYIHLIRPKYVEISFLLLIITLVIYQIAKSFSFPRLAGTFPTIVGVPTVILAVYVLISEIRSEKNNGEVKQEDLSPAHDQIRLVQGLLWVVLLLGLVLILGMVIGSIIFLILYYRFERELNWLRIFGYTAMFLVFIVFIFQTILQIPLYEGFFAIPQELPL